MMFNSLNDRFNIPRVTALASGKGGVGKSLISVGMAGTLAGMSQRVLLVDAVTGLGNLHIMTNTIPVYTFEDVIENDCEIGDAVLKITDNFDLLASASGVQTSGHNYDIGNLRMKFAGLKLRYDQIIIDIPSGISEKTLNFTGLADRLILVVTSDLGSLADSYALLKLLKTRGIDNNCGLLVNMAESEKDGLSTGERFAEMARQFLGLTMKHKTWLPHDPKIRSILLRQNLLAHENSDCPFFEQLQSAVKNIFSETVKDEAAVKNKSGVKINSEITLSSQRFLSDRRNEILHAGELEDNVVNTNSSSSRKDSL